MDSKCSVTSLFRCSPPHEDPLIVSYVAVVIIVVNSRDRPIIHSSSGHPSLSMVVNREVGARSMSVWVTFHEPGEVVPLHTHECEEIITIIAGEAIVTVAGESIPE